MGWSYSPGKDLTRGEGDNLRSVRTQAIYVQQNSEVFQKHYYLVKHGLRPVAEVKNEYGVGLFLYSYKSG